MAALLPAQAAETVSLTIDPIVMLFAAALAIGTGVLFGLFPALHSTRPDLISSLKGQSGQPSGARSASRFRTSLATAQIALSMALLVSAGLFTRSLFNISRVDLGLQAEHVITFQISPARNGYKVEQSAAAVRAGRGRARRAAGRHQRDQLHGAAARRQQLGQRRGGRRVQGRSRHRLELALQRGRAGLFPDAGHPAARRARLHARRRADRAARSRSSTRRSRRSSISGATRSASASATRGRTRR